MENIYCCPLGQRSHVQTIDQEYSTFFFSRALKYGK